MKNTTQNQIFKTLFCLCLSALLCSDSLAMRRKDRKQNLQIFTNNCSGLTPNNLKNDEQNSPIDDIKESLIPGNNDNAINRLKTTLLQAIDLEKKQKEVDDEIKALKTQLEKMPSVKNIKKEKKKINKRIKILQNERENMQNEIDISVNKLSAVISTLPEIRKILQNSKTKSLEIKKEIREQEKTWEDSILKTVDMIRILLPAEQYLSACESTLLFNKHKEQSVNKERDIKMYELEKQRDKECGKVLQKILIEQNLPPQSLILKSTGNSEKQVSNVESLGSKDKTQLLNLACALLTLQRSTKLVLEKVIEQEALRVVNEAANGNNAFAIQFLEEYWVMQKKGNNPTIIDIE